MRHWIDDLLGVIFPNICYVCGRPLAHGEDILCLHCLTDIPVTGLADDGFNEIHRRLAKTGLPIEKAASWFYYRKDTDFARLIQRAKYGDRPKIARALAFIYAEQLNAAGFFDGITTILPVPISTLKRLKRGFNQSEEIAKGISKATSIPLASYLKVRHHSTQTRRSHYDRWLNAKSIYSLKSNLSLDNEHLLIVDDVITSGATMVSCLDTIHTAFPSAKLSVLSLALTAD